MQANALQLSLVWFFTPATPSHTSFSDSSIFVERSFIGKKLQIVISQKNIIKTLIFLHKSIV